MSATLMAKGKGLRFTRNTLRYNGCSEGLDPGA